MLTRYARSQFVDPNKVCNSKSEKTNVLILVFLDN
jgi:hypothetical protein